MCLTSQRVYRGTYKNIGKNEYYKVVMNIIKWYTSDHYTI